MGRRFHGNRNDSGSLLASIFILTLGGGSCLFMVAAMAPQSMPIALSVLGGITGTFVLLVVLQRFGKLPQTSLSFLLTAQKNRRDDGAADYLPRKANERSSGTPVGTNRPISAEEVHEIQLTSANTWVPAPSKRKPKKQPSSE